MKNTINKIATWVNNNQKKAWAIDCVIYLVIGIVIGAILF
jgi:hypothetical protein